GPGSKASTEAASSSPREKGAATCGSLPPQGRGCAASVACPHKQAALHPPRCPRPWLPQDSIRRNAMHPLLQWQLAAQRRDGLLAQAQRRSLIQSMADPHAHLTESEREVL